LPTKRENILIVEPDAKSRQQLLELLRSAGYDASSAPTQQDGFTIVQNGAVDLFLLLGNHFRIRRHSGANAATSADEFHGLNGLPRSARIRIETDPHR